MEIKVFEIDGRWAYRVGAVYQDWNPDEPGFVPMTQEEAYKFAEIVKSRLEA